MNDQAHRLRDAAAARAEGGVGPPSTPALVVGSGKGGVGKSFVSATLALSLADRGHRVLLVDGDQNLGNLHVLLGVRPALTPEALLDDHVAAHDLAIGVAPNCWLLPADSGADVVQRLSPTDRARLHRRITALYRDYDLVIIDAAAGLDCALRCVTLHATRLVVVTVPEPASLTDAYALVKVVHLRQPDMPCDVVVNRVTSDDEAVNAFSRLSTATDRFLRRGIGYLGAVPEDLGVRTLMRDPNLLHALTHTAAQRAIAAIAPHCIDTATPSEDAAA